jgi:hypothetical protein
MERQKDEKGRFLADKEESAWGYVNAMFADLEKRWVLSRNTAGMLIDRLEDEFFPDTVEH